LYKVVGFFSGMIVAPGGLGVPIPKREVSGRFRNFNPDTRIRNHEFSGIFSSADKTRVSEKILQRGRAPEIGGCYAIEGLHSDLPDWDY